MASSSMCGPSNPLQQLKNHTSFDRSIQQDRFRPSTGLQPSSQFRHQPLQSQSLDHEFEQFLGTPPGPSQQHQTLRNQRSIQNFAPAPSPALQQQQQPWATDFQRSQINTPPPAAQLQQRPTSAGFSGWGSEFLQQMNAPAATAMSAGGSLLLHQNGMLGGSGYMGMNNGYMGVGASSYQTGFQQSAPSSSSLLQEQGGKVDYTDAEFDMMFEEAAVVHQIDQAEMMQFPQREVPNPLLAALPSEARTQIEEVKPEEATKEERDRERDDADELSKTAGKLLDTLSQDTSQKFQESQFVALMRKLRDKTVKVEDGKMVEV